MAGLCLDIHDVALSKYAANRPKDHVYLAALIEGRHLERATLEERAREIPANRLDAIGGLDGLLDRIRSHFEAPDESPSPV